ncbi:MAG: acetate--CoA ligase family protein, partial [Promethearchaeota archaeon]
TNPPEVARIIHQVVSKHLKDKPIVCSFIGEKSVSEAKDYLKRNRIPCFQFPDRAAYCIKVLIKRGDILKSIPIYEKKIPIFEANRNRVKEIIENARLDDRTVLLSHETSEIFECYGIHSPKSKLARTPREAMEIQKEIGKSAIKIVSPQIIHKTDVGGIVLNVETPQDAFDAFTQIIDNVKRYSPPNLKIYGVEIQEMIDFKKEKKVIELIMGMSKDPQFGPLLMIGAGGIYANFLKDVSFGLAYKFTEEDAREMLKKTRVYSLLQGVRGESPSDIDAIINVLLRVAQLVNDFPEILELDINPLLSFIHGYSAVDIKITISRD